MRFRKMIFTLIAALIFTAAPAVGGAAARALDEPSAAYDGYIVKLNTSARRSLRAPLSDALEPVPYSDGLYLTEDLDAIGDLLDSGLVSVVEPNYILEPLDTGPGDPLFPDQWALDAIGYLSLYGSDYDGSGVTVAVIDSGLYAWRDGDGTYHGHEEFGQTSISPYSRNFLGTEEEASPLYYRDQRAVGHGTFVTSQIAAGSDNGVGMAGIAQGAELMILRCISYSGSQVFPYDGRYDANSGSAALVASAIRYAADHGAQVINISLGAKSASNISTLQDAIDYAHDRGVIIVAAAGNDGSQALFYPAASDHVIGVGSVSRTGGRSSFSQYNSSVSVTAPGDAVLGVAVYPGANGVLYASPEDSYIPSSGTSYASPVVAALAAVAKEVNHALDCDDFLALLAVTAEDRGEISGWDAHFGYGVADLDALLTALTETAYPIKYALGYDADDPLPDGSYTLSRTEDLTLPIPTRPGYRFEGWYETEGFSGEPVTVLPMGALGMAKSAESGDKVSYYIDDLTFHAKWSEAPAAQIEAVTVRGYPARPLPEEENGYAVTLPASAIDNLEALASVDIHVVPSSSVTPSIEKLGDDGTSWRITLPGSPDAVYSLTVAHSAYEIPAVVPGAVLQSGAALLPPLHGPEEAETYTADAAPWFIHAQTYKILSCDGNGEAKMVGSTLTYTPEHGVGDEKVTDYQGQQVKIVLGAENPDFQSEETVTVTIDVGRRASNSVLDSASGSYDLYVNTGGQSVGITLYGNALTGLYLEENPVSPDSYLAVSADVDGDDVADALTVTLNHSFLSALPLGESVLTFRFSAGADAAYALTLTDSAPRYSVSFYAEKTDPTPFSVTANIRSGGKLTLPAAEPAKTGYIFSGWYLADGSTRVTANTVVTAPFSAYAKWSENTGGPGSGVGLGGGGGSALPDPGALLEELPPGTTAYSAEDLTALLKNGENQTLTLTGNRGAALSGQVLALAAKAKTDLSIKGGRWQLSLPWKLLQSIGAQDGDQAYFVVSGAAPDRALLSARGINEADVLQCVRLEALVYTGEDAPAPIGGFEPPAQLSLFIGPGYAGRTVRILAADGSLTAALEAQVSADGYITLETAHPATFTVYTDAPFTVFSDVSSDDWFYTHVRTAFSLGLMQGTDESRFTPKTTATRAMLATILHRMSGSPAVSGSAEFGDLSAGMWYTDAVTWATQTGLLSGYGDGLFGTDDPITRQQLAVLLWRYAGSPKAEGGLPETFSDGKTASDYAVQALTWALREGILTGRDNGTLDPSGLATRAEIAAMLSRFDPLLNPL